jgi:predicted DNA-binding transcriptional regulator YafY
MDRALDARLTDDEAPLPPPDIDDVLARGAPFIAAEDVEVIVRYSPRIARWVIEQAPDAALLQDDGSVLVRHRVADPRWLVRHVLQYAGDAVIDGPQSARAGVVEAARRLAR